MSDFVDRKATPFSSFHDPRGHLSFRDLPCPHVSARVRELQADRHDPAEVLETGYTMRPPR
jgi:hypothetical protein